MKLHKNLTKEFINEQWEEELACGIQVPMMDLGYCVDCGEPSGADYEGTFLRLSDEAVVPQATGFCTPCNSPSVFHIAFLFVALNDPNRLLE